MTIKEYAVQESLGTTESRLLESKM